MLQRIDSNIINETIYNIYRSKGSSGRSEPKWNSLIHRFGLENFITKINTVYNRDFKYEI